MLAKAIAGVGMAPHPGARRPRGATTYRLPTSWSAHLSPECGSRWGLRHTFSVGDAGLVAAVTAGQIRRDHFSGSRRRRPRLAMMLSGVPNVIAWLGLGETATPKAGAGAPSGLDRVMHISTIGYLEVVAQFGLIEGCVFEENWVSEPSGERVRADAEARGHFALGDAELLNRYLGEDARPGGEVISCSGNAARRCDDSVSPGGAVHLGRGTGSRGVDVVDERLGDPGD